MKKQRKQFLLLDQVPTGSYSGRLYEIVRKVQNKDGTTTVRLCLLGRISLSTFATIDDGANLESSTHTASYAAGKEMRGEI